MKSPHRAAALRGTSPRNRIKCNGIYECVFILLGFFLDNCYISIVITYDIEELPCDVPNNLKLKFMVIDNGIANSTGSDFRSLPVLLL